MKRTVVFSLAVFILGITACAGDAGQDADFSCEPDSIRVEQRGGKLHLEGSLQIPTPGYAYSLSRAEREGATQHLRLTLDGPAGPVAQVISSLHIRKEFDAPVELERVRISIDKSFAWGPDRIVCRKTVKKARGFL